MRQLQITPLDGYDPEIGRWLWALQDVRRRYTLRLIQDLDARLVDWEGPDGRENAIGSLLYHIARVEIGWLYTDVKQMKADQDLQALRDREDCKQLLKELQATAKTSPK